MKISCNWLKEYLNISLSAEKLEEELTFSGIEVEAVEHKGELLSQIIVSEIKESSPHPNSDHLSICRVDNGNEEIQVICGAPNCQAGKKVALAPVGANLGEFKIKKAKLRGEFSCGMLCSEKELGISDNHDGIMILPNGLPLGSSLAEHYDIADTVFDVEITPNRPDLLGITGIARDLSALLGKELHMPEPLLAQGSYDINDFLQLDNQAPDLCPRYTARMIKDVTITESPEWLKQHLEAVGLRPINNVVDVTNFVMMELGHPLHAFDYKLLQNSQIIVRRAFDGEKFTDLQSEEHILLNSDLVIADTKKPVALAGVIGAENSQISRDTKNIVIEAANFLYSSVRKTSKRLALFTDSAYRFERGMSDEQAEYASKRCCELILKVAGGKLVNGKLDSYPKPFEAPLVSVRPSRVKHVLNVWIDPDQIISFLESLGLKLHQQSSDCLQFNIPHFRNDLTREIDLIEEIIRLYGYNNVEEKFVRRSIMDNNVFRSRRMVMDHLVNRGFYEVVNWSFSDPADLDDLKLADDDCRRNTVSLQNPLGIRYSLMRPLLLPDILRNISSNIKYGQHDLKLFEMNKVFLKGKGKLAEESYQITGVITGRAEAVFWDKPQRMADFYDVKGIVEEVLSILHLNDYNVQSSQENFYQKAAALDFLVSDTKIATAGKLDAKVCRGYDIESECFAFVIYLDKIFSCRRNLLPAYQEIPKFPPVLRDLSFIIDKQFDLKDIQNEIEKSGGKLIKEIILYDEFKGKNIPAEKRSLTFSLTFSSAKKTLTDALIADLMAKIRSKLEEKFNIEMR